MKALFSLLIMYLFAYYFHGANMLIIDRIGVNGKYYAECKIRKTDLPPLREDISKALPEAISYFEFKMSEADRMQISTCVTYIEELKKEYAENCNKKGMVYTDSGFGKYWIKKRQSCYFRLVKLFPKLYFDFNIPKASDYRISSVEVNIYYPVQKLGTAANPYINKDDIGSEVIILDHTVGKKEYQLSKKHDLSDKKNFVLELALLTSDFRSDDVPRKYLVDFTFKFKANSGNVEVKSSPFFIDL